MQYMQSSKKSTGFTLVEVMVIAPIVILVIGAFVGLIITLTGDVLKTSATNKATYDVQAALDIVEQDVKLSSGFINTSFIPLQNQGSNNITTTTGSPPTAIVPASAGGTPTAFAYGKNMVIRTAATTKNPLDSTKKLVYLKDAPYSCDSPNVSQNTPLLIDIVYYTVRTDLSTTQPKSSLLRRVVFPNDYTISNICGGTVWQQPSCSPNLVDAGNTNCISKDQEVLTDFAFSGLDTIGLIKYYATPDSTTQVTPANASSVELFFQVMRSVAGKYLIPSGTLRATAINSSAYQGYTVPAGAGTAPSTPIFTGNWPASDFESANELKWQIPASSGSSPITGYRVRLVFRSVCTDSPQVINATIPSSSIEMSGDQVYFHTGVATCTKPAGASTSFTAIADAYASAVNGAGTSPELSGLILYGFTQ